MPEPSPEIGKIIADRKQVRSRPSSSARKYSTWTARPCSTTCGEKIEAQFHDQIASYYERDGFFIVKNQDDKPEIAEAVADLYRALRPDEAVLQQIIEIPFPLAVSV